MTNPYDAEYDRLLTEYRRQLDTIGETQRRLGEISCTETSPRRVVSVTVGHGGVVTDVTFPTSAYRRFSPAELSAQVLATVTAARERALAEAAEILAPSVPAGVDATALLSGQVRLETLMRPPAEVGIPGNDVRS